MGAAQQQHAQPGLSNAAAHGIGQLAAQQRLVEGQGTAVVAAGGRKLAVLAFMYQCAAAALEPVCDRRITDCVGAAAEGHKLLVKMLAYSAALFIIVIAMACSATNAVYFSR